MSSTGDTKTYHLTKVGRNDRSANLTVCFLKGGPVTPATDFVLEMNPAADRSPKHNSAYCLIVFQEPLVEHLLFSGSCSRTWSSWALNIIVGITPQTLGAKVSSHLLCPHQVVGSVEDGNKAVELRRHFLLLLKRICR